MRPLLLALLLLAVLLLAAPSSVLAQKDKPAKAKAADKELETGSAGDVNEEENEIASFSAGADKANIDVLNDYAEDSFSYAPALRKDPDNVALVKRAKRAKKVKKVKKAKKVKKGKGKKAKHAKKLRRKLKKRKSGRVPRGKKVGGWYSLRTPKDLLDGLDDGVKKDLSGAGGLCGQKKKKKIVTRSGKVKIVKVDACAVPRLPSKVLKRSKKVKKPRYFADDDDALAATAKQLKKKKKFYREPSEQELADALVPRSQMIALTKKEERRATDEYASLMKGKRHKKAGIPFPGVPIGVDGEKIGRKGFRTQRGRKFRAGREDIMPLGRKSGRKGGKAAGKKGRLRLIDPSDLAPLLDGSFLEMETDVIRAFNDASDEMEKQDGGEVAEEALVF